MNVGAFPATGAFTFPNVAGFFHEKRFVVADSKKMNSHSQETSNFDDVLESRELQSRINLLTIGIALVDLDQRLLYANKSFSDILRKPVPVNVPFYDALGDCEIEGPDFCPFSSVRSNGKSVTTTIRIASRFFELVFSPVSSEDGSLYRFVVEMRDVTPAQKVNDTLRRLLELGAELTDLPSNKLVIDSPEERKELLRQKVENGLKNILHYSIFEIRTLEETTGRLKPFLAFGISPEARERTLVSSSNENGITGYVAHNKVCYYCEETLDHPFYLPGSPDTRSSLTIPLVWRDKVIGTCNVECTEPCAFSELDIYYLQIFMRDVATALHLLDVLSFEQVLAVQTSLGAVIESIASPIDEIIQNTACLLDANLDVDPSSISAFRKILENVRVIKDQVTLVRRRVTSAQDSNEELSRILNRRRILVVDRDPDMLSSAHSILEDFGCIVETAPDALIALKMLRCSDYDAVICEIKPEGGMSGYQLMLRMFDLYPNLRVPPLLLSTGFGYDPGHTLVSANKKGLLGVLYKPFIPRQVFDKLEGVINICGKRDEDGNLIPPSEIEGGSPKPRDGETSPLPRFPQTESRHSGKQTSFFSKREGGRFKNWFDRIQNQSPESDETTDDQGKRAAGDESGFDAT